jgi:hypothetical protein
MKNNHLGKTQKSSVTFSYGTAAVTVARDKLFNKRYRTVICYTENPYEGISLDARMLVSALRELYGDEINKW